MTLRCHLLRAGEGAEPPSNPNGRHGKEKADLRADPMQ